MAKYFVLAGLAASAFGAAIDKRGQPCEQGGSNNQGGNSPSWGSSPQQQQGNSPSWGSSPQPQQGNSPSWGFNSPQPQQGNSPSWGSSPQPQQGNSPSWGFNSPQPQQGNSPSWGSSPQPQQGNSPSWGFNSPQPQGNSPSWGGNSPPAQAAGGAPNCAAVDSIVSVMHLASVATPYCSSLLNIVPVTQTSTVTQTPATAVVTVTTSVPTTGTVTSYATSTILGITTVYPVVAISTTSTCALGATVLPAAGASKVKRNWVGWGQQPPAGFTHVPIGTPTCLTKYPAPSLNAACSCLNIPTPTALALTTVTLPVQTITKVIAAVPASVTITSSLTTTSFTSTYSATQYYTSTFTILPTPSAISNFADGSSFASFTGLSFYGMDIQNFYCYPGGPSPPSPFPACQSYADCVAECVYYNDNNLGNGVKCGAVTYNAPSDMSSGSCYLKTGQVGCGGANSMTNSSVILPLIANDVQ